MNDLLGWIIAVWMAIASSLTVNFLLTDYRSFDHVVKACQTTGYIQDTKTRIICAPEKPVSRN
jgi:hypothetical protein